MSVATMAEGWNISLRDAFDRSSRVRDDDHDDEEKLIWAALERIPTYDRMRKGVLKQVLDDGEVVHNQVDLTKLGKQQKKLLVERLIHTAEADHEDFLTSLRERINRVGIEIPKIEVKFDHLSVEGEVHVGRRALPTLLNATMNVVEGFLDFLHLASSQKMKINILKDISGLVKPSRMTLLLGPPGAGKTTLLLALAGKLDHNLNVKGKVTYCGHELDEFVPQRMSSYISQHDLHHGEMTVRETLDFSGRCLGVGTKYGMLAELIRREKELRVKPDPEIDIFMKAALMTDQKSSLVTEYVLKMLGLDICRNTLVGDQMRRGISGGEKKRLTTGEMLVGPAQALFMDEISNGLDSSTTFQIAKFMKQIVHIMDVTVMISLLQPAPETFELFDDIIFLSEGQVVYQGPREHILEFFEYMGFKCPERKGVADFIQEVTSEKDQEQYWFKKTEPYQYITVSDFVQGFGSFHIGHQLAEDLGFHSGKSESQSAAALATKKYGISDWELFKTCFSREWLLIKRNSFVYIFKTCQITIMSLIALTVFLRIEMPHGTLADSVKFYGALYFSLTNVMYNGLAELSLTVIRLPVFYRHRDLLFYPTWAFGLPIWLLKIPLSLIESGIWIILTYYTIGFAPSASRFFKQLLALFNVHNMSLALFRLLAAVGRTEVMGNTLGTFTLVAFFVFGGFILARKDIVQWLDWGYYVSPMMYGLNAIAINEFLDERWNGTITDPRVDAPTVGKAILKARGLFTEDYWYWICIAALAGFSIIFNVLFIVALKYLNPTGDSKAVLAEENDKKKAKASISMDELQGKTGAGNSYRGRGMVLPFQPLSLAFNHVNYHVDMPSEMKTRGAGDRLQLLQDVSGAFRPGVLTALVGVSGAGKTTLMDVLTGRKTGGYTEGNICISGYPKKQETFARISGYCEQNDIHSPNVTVYESLVYSSLLRLSSDITTQTRKMFVEEVMELVELQQLRDTMVGVPDVDGLSTEQRKRLTIAVELVANPSIIFMDEPTSGLDARAAAIVMRTVRNTVDTGRTVVCTIHQPSINIFEAFDELLLMKRGGQAIYTGPLGRHSQKLVEYFEAIPGVPKIKTGYNPATWMLEITAPPVEAKLGVDFAHIYTNSAIYQGNQELIKELSTPVPGSSDLHFATKYSQPFLTQFKACFWKQNWSYWRNPLYNAIRLLVTVVLGVMFGAMFWNKGDKIAKEQDVVNLLGAMYGLVIFLGSCNSYSVLPVVANERIVFYRERAAGMYSALPYAFAQVAIEIVYIAIQSAVYTILIYCMIGLDWRVGKLFWFYYYIFMSFNYFTLFGQMLVALSPGYEIAAILMFFFVSLWNLFAGFMIPRPLIPVWWRWYYWATPPAWTIYGIVTSQIGDKDTLVEVPGASDVPLKSFLKDNLGFHYSFLPVVAVAHIGFVFLFIFVFAYGIKFLNFQRR